MIDIDSTQDVEAPRTAAEALAQRVRRVLSQSNGRTHARRVSVPVEPTVTPLAWLQAQGDGEGFYWSDRNGATPDVAGYGTADLVTVEDQPLDYDAVWSQMRPYLEAQADGPVRYYGGIRFDAHQPDRSPDGLWKPFGTVRFVLPRVEMVSNGTETVLACNLLLPRDAGRASTLVAAIEELSVPATTSLSQPPLPLSRTDAPDECQWTQMVRWGLEAFERNTLQKVVFARRVLLQLEHKMDPLNVLAHLADATPSCTHFAVRPSEGTAFIGASPERLFRQSGTEVVSEAVAGTRPRGTSPQEDEALRRELLRSEKDRREHAFVTTAIGNALRPLCTSLDAAGNVSELRLARGRHLHAHLAGILRDDVRPVDLLAALHPTPAVAGVPTQAALTAISQHEPFDRGWYAGPVGWMGRDEAEFTVAIRSGLVRGDRLALYSGAGIVDGSDPRREWGEIEQKLSDFAAVLGIDD